MRKIKFFLESFEKSDYYYQVSEEVYDNVRDKGLFKSFDKRLVDKLVECGYNSTDVDGAPNWLEASCEKLNKVDIIMVWRNYHHPTKHVMVFSLDDEWYLVRIVEAPSSKNRSGVSVFKCDQEEGLWEFLKDYELL